MAAVTGRKDWSKIDGKEGDRTYKIVWLVKGTAADGPQTISNATGLPAVGAAWSYGGDSDAWALRTPQATVKPVVVSEPGEWWTVEHTFSTSSGSTGERERCQDDAVENPLLEPPEISGGFTKYTKEATLDKEGAPITSSSHETFRGAAVEFDDNRPTVVITLNEATLPITTFTGMVDTVNDSSLWGLPARSVKLSNVSWKRLYYGTCSKYYKITYTFDLRDDDDGLGFDRKLVDEGTKILSEGGSAANPEDFEVYKDVNGENTRVLLDGAGGPLADATSPFEILVEFYHESNFLSLGIPTTL